MRVVTTLRGTKPLLMPTTNVLKCFKETAKITKEGKTLTRALVPVDIALPLIYDGPSDIEELSKIEEYRDQTLVNVGGKRIVRTRPIFRVWAFEAEWELLTDVLSIDDFVAIAKRAGRVEGLGDNRVNGYGRFETDVAEIAEMKEAA